MHLTTTKKKNAMCICKCTLHDVVVKITIRPNLMVIFTATSGSALRSTYGISLTKIAREKCADKSWVTLT